MPELIVIYPAKLRRPKTLSRLKPVFDVERRSESQTVTGLVELHHLWHEFLVSPFGWYK
jgi:hypothetical protein